MTPPDPTTVRDDAVHLLRAFAETIRLTKGEGLTSGKVHRAADALAALPLVSPEQIEGLQGWVPASQDGRAIMEREPYGKWLDYHDVLALFNPHPETPR